MGIPAVSVAVYLASLPAKAPVSFPQEPSAAVRRLLSWALTQSLSDALSVHVLPTDGWWDAPGFPLPPETRGAHGQPYPGGIVTPAGRRHISLSHSGKHLAAAIAAHPVGLDIQTPVPPETAARISRRLAPGEQALFLAQPACLWAAKESVLKLTGEGLSRRLNSFCLVPDSEDTFQTAVDGRPVRIQWKRESSLTLAVAYFDTQSG